MIQIVIGRKGGAGSGNWGHEGRPGKEGGSLPTGRSSGGGGGVATGGAEPAGVPVQSANTMTLPRLSIPIGTVPEHEKGDRDGKLAYQEWYASLEEKPNLADALQMRRFFAERALEVEAQLNQAQAEETAAEREARLAEEEAKGPAETPAQKKKRLADEKKAATAAASAKKKAESEAAKKKKAEESAQKKAESEAKKADSEKKKAAAAAAKKGEQAKAAEQKKKAAEQAAEAKRKAQEEAANAKRTAQQTAERERRKAEEQKAKQKTEAQLKVATSVGMTKAGLDMLQSAYETLKAGDKLKDNVAKTLEAAGLVAKQGDTYTLPSAARSLLSAILAGDAIRARDAMTKLKSGKKELPMVRMTKVGDKIIIG